MQAKNTLFVGILYGILLPTAVFFLLTLLYSLLEGVGVSSMSGLSLNFRERTSAILAIATNLWPLRIFQDRRWSEALRGIVIATAALAIAWVFYFGRDLM
jgi:hypothetical protein